MSHFLNIHFLINSQHLQLFCDEPRIPFTPQSDDILVILCLWQPYIEFPLMCWEKLGSNCTPFHVTFITICHYFPSYELLSHLCVELMHDMSLAIFVCHKCQMIYLMGSQPQHAGLLRSYKSLVGFMPWVENTAIIYIHSRYNESLQKCFRPQKEYFWSSSQNTVQTEIICLTIKWLDVIVSYPLHPSSWLRLLVWVVFFYFPSNVNFKKNIH